MNEGMRIEVGEIGDMIMSMGFFLFPSLRESGTGFIYTFAGLPEILKSVHFSGGNEDECMEFLLK